jgi:tRNA-splicing endonuclease subunit Sen34
LKTVRLFDHAEGDCLNIVNRTEVAVLLDDATGHRVPTEEELEAWSAKHVQGNTHKVNESGQRGIDPKSEPKTSKKDPRELSQAALQKRRERERNRALATAAKGEDGDTPPAPPSPAESQHIQIATTSTEPWYAPKIYSTLSEAKEAGIWTYPSSVLERARCAVFRDLSEKGNYIGGGLRFGGDWLVYPGMHSLTLGLLV